MTEPVSTADASLHELRKLYTPRLATWLRSRLSTTGSSTVHNKDVLPVASTTQQYLRTTMASSPSPVEPCSDDEIIYYLAYGSNLSKETFLGRRGIKPLSAINVVVPSLRLTFDLPGIPYSEPCFANSGRRHEEDDSSTTPAHQIQSADEKTPLLSPSLHSDTAAATRRKDYHKNRWHKGMVGVVYGLTPTDYAHVIATEGAGASYQDVTVPCHPLLPGTDTVPLHPATPPLNAHTLFAPTPHDPPSPGNGGRFRRPDPSYAQPSARYMKLLTDGAAEHAIPAEYQDYLHQIRPYTLTSQKQRMGQFVFLSLWRPIITILFAMTAMFADERGRSPAWLVSMAKAIFEGVWGSYDGFFFGVFGEGERTVSDGDGDGDEDEDEEDGGRRVVAGREVGDGRRGDVGSWDEKRHVDDVV